jgi:PAS domain S-box-containing protein
MSLIVRVIAPSGRDAELIAAVLRQHNIAAEIWNNTFSALHIANDPIGPLLIAEEALSPAFIQQLARILQQQPAWSDLPLLILTGNARETTNNQRFEYERLPLGSPVLLERPLRTASLVSSVRAALRARARQYETRDALRDLDGALATIKQERETLQVMLDNLPVGVVFARANGQIVLANRRLDEILRHTPPPTPDIESHGQWIAFHPDGRRVQAEEFPLTRAILTAKPVPPEDFLYQRGDDTLAWISLTAAPILNEHNEVLGGVVAVSDIDQQKRFDEDLRRSNERFVRLIEKATVGLLIGSTDGTVSYVNPALQAMLGYTAEEVAHGHLRWDDITPPSFAEADRNAIQQLLATGTATAYQKEFRARDGRLIPVLIAAVLIPAPRDGDQSSEVAAFISDLSIQKKSEAALVQSEKLAVVGRLAASISHEINNPLESVTNLLYLSQQNPAIPEEVKLFLSTADQELQRVSQIVAQTLRFHRQSTKPRAVTPQELLETTLSLYQRRLNDSRIELQIQHRGAGPIVCYENDIRQVLNNLVGNAVDAMRQGGRLIIRTSPAHLHRDGLDGVRITIADTGHGMSEAIRRRIFEPFYTTKGIHGTGLGLWISFGIIEKHHGRLQVHSCTLEGRTGTTFSLLLPAKPSDLAATPAP